MTITVTQDENNPVNKSTITFSLFGENQHNYKMNRTEYTFEILKNPLADLNTANITEGSGNQTIKDQYFDLVSVKVTSVSSHSI